MTQTALDEQPTREHNPWVMLSVVLIATFMLLVDVSIVNVAVPSIQRGLHASDAEIQLVVASYSLAFAMVLITGARLGDIYGRRRLFLIGVIGFTASSALCGGAPNAITLIVARVLQGVFGGLMIPQVLSVIQVTFPPRERGRAFGIYGAVIGLATILGPALGGLLIGWNVGHLSWRLIFYVNVPIGILAVVGAVLYLQESRAPDAPRLDIPGTIIVTVAAFCVVYPLVEGRQENWPGWLIGLLVASAPLLVLFGWYERRRTLSDRWPLVHTSLFSDRSFRAGMILVLVFLAGLPAFFFTLALYLQVGYGFTPLHSGLTTLPFAVSNVFGSILSTRLTARLGRGVLAIGTLLLSLGMIGVLLTVTRLVGSVNSYAFIPALLVSGLGLGFFLAPVTNIVLAGIQSKAAGSASGVLSAVQQVGAAIGIALVGVVFFGALPSAIASAHAQTGKVPPAIQATLAHAFRHAMERALGYEIAVYLLSFVVVWWLPRQARPDPETVAT